MSVSGDSTHWIRFETFGVPIEIELSSAALLDRVPAILPPERREREAIPEGHRFRLVSRDGVSYRVVSPGNSLSGSSDVDVALEVLDSELRAFIARQAPDHVFVHAGVVAIGGNAVVIPGPTFSGKSSLVAEFVKAGATYYSDEFAVLDAGGLVHPYPKPVSLRAGGLSQSDFAIGQLGGTAGEEAVPVSLVLVSRYVPGSRWSPQELSPGEATLAVLANTIPAQERPEQSLAALTNALRHAATLEGERGDATEVVEDAFARLGDR